MNLKSSNSVLAERKESFEKSMAQLKSALKIAKSGKKDGEHTQVKSLLILGYLQQTLLS